MKMKAMKNQMKKLNSSLFLFICAIIGTIILLPISILYTIGKIIYRIFKPIPNNALSKTIGRIANTIGGIAKGIDQIGNVVCRDLFNDILITKDGYRFGDVRETLSSVLGKNQERKTLTKIGNRLANVLDSMEKDHCKKSIIYFVTNI